MWERKTDSNTGCCLLTWSSTCVSTVVGCVCMSGTNYILERFPEVKYQQNVMIVTNM